MTGADRFVGRVGTSWRTLFPATATLIGFIAGWAAWVEVAEVERYLLPSPADVVRAGWRTRSVLAGHLAITLGEAVIGFVAGTLIGLAMAVVMTLVEPIRQALQPLLVLFQSVPPVVLAPIFMVWFGFGFLPKVLVVALIALFPVAIAALDGMRSTDPEVVELLRGLGADRLTILRRAQIPSAIPEAVAGAKVGASYAVFGAVVGEGFGASRGLGVYLNRSQASYQTDQIFAAVVLMAASGLVLFSLVSLLGRLASPWVRAVQGD